MFADDVSNNIPTGYLDWLVIALFYSTLHLIDDYCIRHNVNRPNTHRVRRKTVNTNLPQISDAYDNLFTLSLRARYDVPYTQISQSEVKAAWKYHKIIEQINSI